MYAEIAGAEDILNRDSTDSVDTNRSVDDEYRQTVNSENSEERQIHEEAGYENIKVMQLRIKQTLNLPDLCKVNP